MRQIKITNSITNRDSTSVEKYFNEVSRQPLLTPDEEAELARRIKLGDQGALDKMIRANLRFVVSVAKQYQYTRLPFNDLINEGNLGLIKAARMFDETKGFKFISYAVWWIRQSIMDALNQNSRIVRIPHSRITELSKISQASAAMEQKLQRDATTSEIAAYLGLDEESIKGSETANIRQSSLDAPFDDDENSLVNVIRDPNDVPADHMVNSNSSLKTELERILICLNEREKKMIIRYYGIGCEYNTPLEDIATEMGITRERARQIKEQALKKLRTQSSMKLLQSYLC
ncbi:MAG: RNA polymerase sigma factor RpoD/SigA [Cytophagaceae bacterium]